MTWKLEMLGGIVSRLASPRKILGEKKIGGENFFEHSRWHETSRNAKKVKVVNFFGGEKKILGEKKNQSWGRQ